MSAPPLNRVSVAEAVETYLKSVDRAVAGHSLSPNTATNYRRDLTEFVALTGPDTVLDDLTGEDIDDLVLAFGSKPDARYKPKPGGPVKTRGIGAQARFRQSVSRLFTEAVQRGWVEASPMPASRVKPKVKGLTNVARSALPESSAAALLDVPSLAAEDSGTRRKDMNLGLRDEFLLRLLMEAGPRVSEVCNADQADIEHRDDGTHWIRLMGKGRKERWVPLSGTTMATYDDYLKHERPEAQARARKDPETGEPVITTPSEDAERALVLTWRGVRMQPRDVQYMVERACNRLPAEVRRKVTPHGLRHTAATLLLSSGAADIKVVKELLGHASIATTGVYLDHNSYEMAKAISMHPVTGDQPRGSRKPGGQP